VGLRSKIARSRFARAEIRALGWPRERSVGSRGRGGDPGWRRRRTGL